MDGFDCEEGEAMQSHRGSLRRLLRRQSREDPGRRLRRHRGKMSVMVDAADSVQGRNRDSVSSYRHFENAAQLGTLRRVNPVGLGFDQAK